MEGWNRTLFIYYAICADEGWNTTYNYFVMQHAGEVKLVKMKGGMVYTYAVYLIPLLYSFKAGTFTRDNKFSYKLEYCLKQTLREN